MKLYDFDGMFDKKLSDYIAKNNGKYTEEEWEDVVPELYKQFGDTFIKSVGDTPNGFYAKLSDAELVKALKTHIKQGVPVSEYLLNALESRGAAELIIPLLDGSDGEKEYAVRLIGADDRAIEKYLSMLISPDTDAVLKDSLIDNIKQKADLVTAQAVKYYKAGVERAFMLEIMAHSVVPSDDVFNILVDQFRTDIDNITRNAGYLAAYGDERALKYLLDKIDEEGISYIEYRELLLAIEALGGSYPRERDFSSDPYFELIKSGEQSPLDILNLKGKK